MGEKGSRRALLSLLGWLKLLQRLGEAALGEAALGEAALGEAVCAALCWLGRGRSPGRDSGTLDLGSDSQQTALGLRNR